MVYNQKKINVASGIPLGTVLGPILFLVYINDFNEYIQHSTLELFADDSIIYKTIRSKEDAQKWQEDHPYFSSKMGEGLAHVVPSRLVLSPSDNN